MAKKSRAKRRQQRQRERTATKGSPSSETAARPDESPVSLVVRSEPADILRIMSEPSEAALAFSDLELDFFRRGDELERSPPARPAAEESMWDWGAEATLTKTRVA